MFKRFLPQFVIVLVLCVISSVGIITEKAVITSNRNIVDRQTIIIDAGHAALENTID